MHAKMSYKEIKKLEKEVIDLIKEIDFITDPEELAKDLQKLLKILADLKKKNPSEHEKYEEMVNRLLEFNEMHTQ